ncbi:MAG: OmpA family protein [Cyclobacteriaceae bacterium]|nr:OmpA family protein [Cyclobacteriaceae bacterium]MCH8517527.1 OmpA family protein [Cyclobacteriaceae bacterium]
MKNIYLLFLCGMLWSLTSQAQTSFVPQQLGKEVNSEYPEINPVISKDRKTLFFTRVNHPENRFGIYDSQDIWYAIQKPDGTFTEAVRASDDVNIGRHNAILAALDDGRSYIISGVYNRKGTQYRKRGLSIIKYLGDNQWTKPEALNVRGMNRVNRGKFFHAYMTPDEQWIFFALTRRSGSKKLDLYVSRRTGVKRYSKPRSLKGDINNGRSNESPFLSADKETLYFSSFRPREKENFNIFFSKSIDRGYRSWTSPQLVTDTINTSGWENYFKMNTNESFAYFSSTDNSYGGADIFRVKLFEENPFVIVKGKIIDQVEQRPMAPDENYRVLVNGKEHPELELNKRAASFRVKLPLGERYTLEAELENYNGIKRTVDVSQVREYTETEADLYLTSIPYVAVSGQFKNTRNNRNLDLKHEPTVRINGQVVDSVKYDENSASFEVLLPLGRKYTFSPVVANFTGDDYVLDVTNETKYMDKNIDLFVTSYPYVQVSGVVMESNSYQPITEEFKPVIYIDNLAQDSIRIDPKTGFYTLNLPFGKNYNASVQAEGFNSFTTVIDLSNYNEFATLTHNLFAERSDRNLATITGRIINTKTDKALDEFIPVKMRVNGTVTENFEYNSNNATYTIKVPIGTSYDIAPEVRNFYNQVETVDLTKEESKVRVVQNFKITPLEIGASIDIPNIYFETGKSDLLPSSFKSLNQLKTFFDEYPNVVVEIGGHTDNTGSSQLNQRLSEARAASVAKYLIESGEIDSRRISSAGYGQDKPKATNKTAEGRAQNRRVEFTIKDL